MSELYRNIPWKVGTDGVFDLRTILDNKCSRLAVDIFPLDAEYIVKACNSYPDLIKRVAELEKLLNSIVFRKMVPATCTEKIQCFENIIDYYKAIKTLSPIK